MPKALFRIAPMASGPLVFFLFGCAATGEPAEREYRTEDLDSAPVLVQCADSEPSVAPFETADNIRVAFSVQANGQVFPGSVQIVNPPETALRENVDWVLRILPTCRYEPGTIGNRPVAVRMERVFRLSRR